MKKRITNITQMIENILSNNYFLQKLMYAYYRPIVKREVSLLRIKPEDRLLCIGGGNFPCTAILINEITGNKVTVIDNDIECVNKSKCLVKKLGLEGMIKIKHKEAENFNYNYFDVVCVAMQISPMNKVFNNIYLKSKRKRILIRIPKEKIKKSYCPFYNVCNCKSKVKQPFFSNIRCTKLYEN